MAQRDEQKPELSRTDQEAIGRQMPPRHRRARQESASIQSQWAADFRKQFEPYDWTKMLG